MHDLRVRFSNLGFDTTEPIAGSFSITAPRHRFEKVFDTLDPSWFDGPGGQGGELVIDPDSVAAAVGHRCDHCSVFFTAAPDFGPTDVDR